MACHLAGYPDLFLSLMCNTVEEGDGKNPSEAIHDINGTMFQDNVKPLADLRGGPGMPRHTLRSSAPRPTPESAIEHVVACAPALDWRPADPLMRMRMPLRP